MKLVSKWPLPIAFCCLFSICYGQSKKEVLINIRKWVLDVNNNKKLRVVTLDNVESLGPMTDGGNSLTGFFKGDTLCKIIYWEGLSFGVRQYEYYVKNDHLYFVYEREDDFRYDEKKQTLVYKKPVLAFEGRYYLYNKKPMDIKANGQKRFGDKPIIYAVKEMDADIISFGKILKANRK